MSRQKLEAPPAGEKTNKPLSSAFVEGIEHTIGWYLANEKWMNNITSGDYEKYYEQQYQKR